MGLLWGENEFTKLILRLLMGAQSIYRGIFSLVLLVSSISLFAQNRIYLPFQRQVNLPLQNNLDTLGSNFHPDIFPYQSQDVDSTEWFRQVYHGDFASDKFFLDLSLNKKSENYPLKLSVSPIGEILTGFESGLDAKTFV